MNSRMINFALRAVPTSVRENNGAAIVGMAADMIDAGQSTTVKEARGIAGYGVKKRLLLNRGWLRALPWGEALRRLALPIAIAQVIALVYTARGFDAVAFAWPGKWAAAALIAGVMTIVGAAAHRRGLLGVGAVSLLVLFLLDTYGSGGSMLGGVSHTKDFSFSFARDTILAPMALVMIPTTLLLVAAAFSDPTKSADAPRRAVQGLAGGIVLASQAPLLGLQLAFSVQSIDGPIALAYGLFALAMLVPLVAAWVLVRKSAGPDRLA